MKFENNLFLKHNNCIDSFIRIKSVITDTGTKSIVWVYWMIQGVDGYWYASDVDRLFITKEYENWSTYEPKGKLRYG